MTEPSSSSEGQEARLARSINIAMLAVVCLLLIAALIWLAVDQGPLALDILQLKPGEHRKVLPLILLAALPAALLLRLGTSLWRKWKLGDSKQP